MDVFSTRELAAGIWISIILLCIISKPGLRTPFHQLLRSAFASKLSIVWISGALWTALGVSLLRMFGLWTVDDIKDTVIWAVSAGVVVLVRGFSQENGQSDYAKLVKDLFKVTLLIEIIVSTYCFNLLTELILFFVFAVLGALSALSDFKKEQGAAQLTNVILLVIAALVIGNSVIGLVGEPNKVFRLGVLKEIFFPVLLTVWLLPISYCFGVVAAYENLFIRLRVHTRTGRRFRLRYRLAVIRHFGISLRNIRTVTQDLIWKVRDVSSICELRAILRDYSEASGSPEIEGVTRS